MSNRSRRAKEAGHGGIVDDVTGQEGGRDASVGLGRHIRNDQTIIKQAVRSSREEITVVVSHTSRRRVRHHNITRGDWRGYCGAGKEL